MMTYKEFIVKYSRSSLSKKFLKNLAEKTKDKRILNILSKHKSKNVRGEVAENIITPMRTLKKLSKSKDWWVKYCAYKNPNLPIKKAKSVGRNITKLDLGDTYHTFGYPLEKGWTSICLDETDKFVGDYSKTPYRDNQFKYIYGGCFLEFETAKSDQEKIRQFKEIFRILKPGGTAELTACDGSRSERYLSRKLRGFAKLAQKAGFNIDFSLWKAVEDPDDKGFYETPSVKIKKN